MKILIGHDGAYCQCGYRLGNAYGPTREGSDLPKFGVALGPAWRVRYGPDGLGGQRVWYRTRYRGHKTFGSVGVLDRDLVLCPKCDTELTPPT